MQSALQLELTRLVQDLDAAIMRAVENPLTFAEMSFAEMSFAEISLAEIALDTAGSNGEKLRAAVEQRISTARRLAEKPRQELLPDERAEIEVMQRERVQYEALVWQVRARAGRLQMLLDSAAQFYSNCFSLNQPADLAYGVLGEWCVMSNPSCLAVDC